MRLTTAVSQLTRGNAQVETAPDEFSNTDETEVRGFELGLAGRITPAWKVYGGCSYLDSELAEGGLAPRKPDTTDAGEGKLLPNVAEHSFTLSSNYRLSSALSIGAPPPTPTKSWTATPTPDPRRKCRRTGASMPMPPRMPPMWSHGSSTFAT